MNIRLASAAFAFAAISATSAGAVVTVVNTTEIDDTFRVANTDLLQQHVANVSSTGSFSREGEVGLSALTDGTFGPLGGANANVDLDAATADGSNSVTYTFDKAYNLTSVRSYAGWDAFRGGQSYTLYFATDAAPTTFIKLASVFNDSNGGGDINTRAIISNSPRFVATHVTALRFTFNGDLNQGYAGYREIDAFGSAVPEPATWALMLAGFGFVGFAARRRRTTVAA